MRTVQRMCATLKRGIGCRGRLRYLWGSAENVRSLIEGNRCRGRSRYLWGSAENVRSLIEGNGV